MYVVLIYDIATDEGSPRVTRNVFKIAKKYLTHIQKSVFEGNLTELNFRKLEQELSRFIRKDRDSVIIFQSREERWMEKSFWGVDESEKTSELLLNTEK